MTTTLLLTLMELIEELKYKQIVMIQGKAGVFAKSALNRRGTHSKLSHHIWERQLPKIQIPVQRDESPRKSHYSEAQSTTDAHVNLQIEVRH